MIVSSQSFLSLLRLLTIHERNKSILLISGYNHYPGRITSMIIIFASNPVFGDGLLGEIDGKNTF